MKPLMIVGLVLVILGVALLGWHGVAYFTTHETVAKVGPVELQGPVQHAVWLGPVLGGVAIVGGVVLMLVGASRKAT
jgi:hypothetical protein